MDSAHKTWPNHITVMRIICGIMQCSDGKTDFFLIDIYARSEAVSLSETAMVFQSEGANVMKYGRPGADVRIKNALCDC